MLPGHQGRVHRQDVRDAHVGGRAGAVVAPINRVGDLAGDRVQPGSVLLDHHVRQAITVSLSLALLSDGVLSASLPADAHLVQHHRASQLVGVWTVTEPTVLKAVTGTSRADIPGNGDRGECICR